MPWLNANAFAALHERAARAEARADEAERSASVADARFDRLFTEYTALRQRGADPSAGNVSPMPVAPVLPQVVLDELQEFATDAELYAHNRIYAEAEIARGTAPDVVATAIRFGRHAPDPLETP